MSDLRAILKTFPAVRTYLEHGQWVQRGDVLAYAPNQQTGNFSTDRFGFRHGALNGAQFDLTAAFGGERYGIVLGASQCFGFALAANSETLPSQLAQIVGFPVLNIAFPEADLRTLHAAAARIGRTAPRPPKFIVAFAGGTGSRYTFTRHCDPLFGPPDFTIAASTLPDVGSAEEDQAFVRLMDYCRFWIGELAALAVRFDCPLTVAVEPTAFEKRTLGEAETKRRLGQARNEAEAQRFAVHRHSHQAFRSGVSAMAAAVGITVPKWDIGAFDFVDELHLTAAATGELARALHPLLA